MIGQTISHYRIIARLGDGMTLRHRIAGRPMETELILSLAIEIAAEFAWNLREI